MSPKNKIVIMLLILLIPAVVALYYDIAASRANAKATWIWNSALIARQQDEIISFAEKQRINLIYLHIDPDQNNNEYRAFIKRAGMSGIAVHALGGDPSWANEAARYQIADFVEWVKQYNKHASKHEKFRGIHLDVEPYNQQAWQTDQRQAIIEGWLAGIQYFVQLTSTIKSLETGADVPFWLDEMAASPQSDAPSINRWMMERFDHVTVMAYRDTAMGEGGVIDVVRGEIGIADQLNKKVIVAVETNLMEAAYTTFYNKGSNYMQEQLDAVERVLGGYRSYHGIAIHDYQGWSDLTPTGNKSLELQRQS